MTTVIRKFPTGAPIPGGAVYLSTVTQTQKQIGLLDPVWKPCWLVWHYFLVEVED